jgi:hypothetical protein
MKTLGQILRDKRNQLGVDLDQASQGTRIRRVYLERIEDGDYISFPTSTHVKGFIKIYARFLNVDEQEALAFYRREFDEHSKIKQQAQFGLPRLKEPSFRMTPQLVVGIFTFFMVLVSLTYVVYQYMLFAGAPTLEIYSPKDGFVTQESMVVVEGRVSADARLTLNNTTLRISDDGYFNQTIPLTKNINVMTFVAVGESGKSTTIKRVVRYD